MALVLSGFRQFENVRRYFYDTDGPAQTRQQFSVDADLDMVRRYKIPLQELPLLCRRLLEGRDKLETIIFTEKEMVKYADAREAATAAQLLKRRAHHLKAGRRPAEVSKAASPFVR
jgi:hypothetical protein